MKTLENNVIQMFSLVFMELKEPFPQKHLSLQNFQLEID